MNPIDVFCEYCGSKPTEKCRSYRRGLGVEVPYFHKVRIYMATSPLEQSIRRTQARRAIERRRLDIEY